MGGILTFLNPPVLLGILKNWITAGILTFRRDCSLLAGTSNASVKNSLICIFSIEVQKNFRLRRAFWVMMYYIVHKFSPAAHFFQYFFNICIILASYEPTDSNDWWIWFGLIIDKELISSSYSYSLYRTFFTWERDVCHIFAGTWKQCWDW